MKKIFYIIAFSFIAGAALAQNVWAIGMITAPIVLKDVLRGGGTTETITVFNPIDGDVVYRLGAEGEVKDWVTFFTDNSSSEPISKITVPPKKYLDLIAKIKIPADTPNGKYTGEIFIIQENGGQASGENSVAVSQMISREVEITVTDKEVAKLVATIIPESYNISDGEPLKIKITYENQGNIAIKPDLQLKIIRISDEKAVFNAIFPFPDTETPIKPAERKTLPDFEWLTAGQEDGKYRAEIKVLVNNNSLDSQSFRFAIGPVSQAQELPTNRLLAAAAYVGRGNMTVGWFVIGSVLLILAGFMNFLFRKLKVKPIVK